MAPKWTEATWVKVVMVMGSVMLIMAGALLGQTFLAGQVNRNTTGITIMVSEISRNTERHDEFEVLTNTTLEKMVKIMEIQTAIVNELNIKVGILEERSR